MYKAGIVFILVIVLLRLLNFPTLSLRTIYEKQQLLLIRKAILSNVFLITNWISVKLF